MSEQASDDTKPADDTPAVQLPTALKLVEAREAQRRRDVVFGAAVAARWLGSVKSGEWHHVATPNAKRWLVKEWAAEARELADLCAEVERSAGQDACKE